MARTFSLKIYEAMAAGLPVVSTSIGAEGLNYRHGENILVADTPAAFAEACLEALADQALARKITANARQMVGDHFSWDRVVDDFEALLEAAPACR